MSDISFSHQFSQQWRGAPPDVKKAIAQELNDIINLLEEDTKLETFSFTYPDLNDHLDDCYAQEFYNNAYANESYVDTNNTASTQNLSAHHVTNGSDDDKLNTDNESVYASLSQQQMQIIQELEAHIEDYLSEHMTSLSDSLRLWLKEEVKNRIQINSADS